MRLYWIAVCLSQTSISVRVLVSNWIIFKDRDVVPTEVGVPVNISMVSIEGVFSSLAIIE